MQEDEKMAETTNNLRTQSKRRVLFKKTLNSLWFKALEDKLWNPWILDPWIAENVSQGKFTHSSSVACTVQTAASEQDVFLKEWGVLTGTLQWVRMQRNAADKLFTKSLIFFDVNNHKRWVTGDPYRYWPVECLPAGPWTWLVRMAAFTWMKDFSFFGSIRKCFGSFFHVGSSQRGQVTCLMNVEWRKSYCPFYLSAKTIPCFGAF